MSQEILYPSQQPDGVANYGNRNTTQTAVTQLMLVPPGTLVDKQGQQNTYNLVPGAYGRYIQKGPVAAQGAPGTTFTGADFTGAALVTGVTYTGVVTLSGGAAVTFIGCTFEGAVTFTAGATLVATGCIFKGVVTTGAGTTAKFSTCRYANIDNAGGILASTVIFASIGGTFTNCFVVG